MTLWGVIVLVISGVLWFLAGSSTNGQPTLGPIYGQPWSTIFILTGLVGLILVIVGIARRKKPSIPPPPPVEPPAPPAPPAEKSE